MNSIRSRLTVYYACAATATAALLFIAGYILLETRLIAGLDALNAAEFHELQGRLGSDYATLSPKLIDLRIRESSEASSALFFINVDEPRTGMVFYSRNLAGRPIPDVKGSHTYSAGIPGIGELRVGEFIEPPFDVTIATPMTQLRAGMHSYTQVCAALLAAMLIVSIGIGLGMSRIILRPIIFIRETASRIGSDNLGERIPIGSTDDELTDLVRLLNRMFDRLETAFSQIKKFSADASHELKTPLTLIRLHGEKLLEDRRLQGDSIEAVLGQLAEVARLDQIVDEMLFLSRAEASSTKLDLQPEDSRALIESFAQDAVVLAEDCECCFVLDQVNRGIAAFEARWLRQVWLNLLTNGLHASPPGGTVTMRSEFAGGTWQVQFEDEGPGMPEAELRQMFERFAQFGSPEHRAGGSGLGLAISKSIVALHNGQIRAENRLDRSGLRVIVTLPSYPSPSYPSA